ncbi:MAG: PASTA domain-containing protein, partial [Alistipes sp.]|nr:PASTA domain-containing protein [Alistipes sp.]
MERLKEYPLLYNALIILLVLLLLAIFSHIRMLIGTRHGARRTVPTLTGIPLAEAEDLAREHDLELIVNDSLFVTIYEGGVVLDQLPEVGVEVKPGRKVYVTINSFSQKMVSLPYVAGRSLRQAKNMLEIAGLEIDKLIYRADMATNYVLEEHYRGELISPDSKRMAEAGSGVTLYVGVENGSGVATVPQVVGLSLREAKSRLWENGFNVGKIEYDEGIDLLTQKDARVYIQTPMLGQVLQLGTTISLRFTLDEEKLTKSRAEASALAAKIAKEQLKLEKQRNETPTD